MKYKVADLSGALLDLSVDRARSTGPTGERDFLFTTTLDWSPSTRWADGGPIIERERIATWFDDQGQEWNAGYRLGVATASSGDAWLDAEHDMQGHTALIAAMRAFVCSKLGEEVELP